MKKGCVISSKLIFFFTWSDCGKGSSMVGTQAAILEQLQEGTRLWVQRPSTKETHLELLPPLRESTGKGSITNPAKWILLICIRGGIVSFGGAEPDAHGRLCCAGGWEQSNSWLTPNLPRIQPPEAICWAEGRLSKVQNVLRCFQIPLLSRQSVMHFNKLISQTNVPQSPQKLNSLFGAPSSSTCGCAWGHTVWESCLL